MPKILEKKKKAKQSPSTTARWRLQRHARSLQILEASALTRLSWLTHGFSTRLGGASELEGPGHRRAKTVKVLNLGFTAWDRQNRVLDNRRKFYSALNVGTMRAVTLRQIHSDIVHRIDIGSPSEENAPQGDALITQARGVLLAIQTADCVPILLADTKNRAIAAIHSGWRGTLRRIAEKTLGRMRMDFGTRTTDVIAVVGPGIGQCCYEVGEEVAREFQSQFPKAREWFDGPFDSVAAGENDPNWLPWLTMRPPGHAPPPARVQLDLIAANRALLCEAGIPASQISSSGFCTSCRTDLFFSHRQEKATGRLMAAIAIR